MTTYIVNNTIGSAVNQLYTLDATGSPVGQLQPDGHILGSNVSTDRLIATRCAIPNALLPGAGQIMSRSKHFAKDTVVSLKIVIPNFWVNGSQAEVGSGADSICTASIEDKFGNITRVTFSGLNQGNITNGSFLISDNVPFIIKKDTPFFVRIWVSNTAGIPYVSGFAMTGDGSNISTSVSDLTAGSGVTQAISNYLPPCAIVGYSDEKCYGLIGDGRMFGTGDVIDNVTGDVGVFARMVGSTAAYINCGITGGSASSFVASHTNRVALLSAYCTDIIINNGINDIYTGGRTSNQVISDLSSAASYFPNNRVYGGTIWPITTSTDGWTTTNNQSYPTIPTSLQANRVAINAAWRSNVMGNVGVFDVADSIESSRNSGILAADTGNILGPNLTNDGNFLNTRGHRWVVSNTKPGSGIINITTGNALDKIVQPVTFAAASSPISYAFGGDVYVGTLTGNLTLVAPIGMTSGNIITFHFQQDATGGRVVTFPDGVFFSGGLPNNKLIVMFMFDGTDFIQLNQSNWS
jgi:hypothetical protein